MIKQTLGKIFLADQRGLLETSQFRRYSTFSFGEFAHEHKAPFGQLYGLNEETLAGGQHLKFTVSQDSCLVLLPITGAVEYQRADSQPVVTDAGEALVVSVAAGNQIQLRNPFEEELISFLHIWVATPLLVDGLAQLLPFDFAMFPNLLLQLSANEGTSVATAPLPFKVGVGQFTGRSEVVYYLPAGHQLFAFIIAGAFEIEGRLLHEHDGLALWETTEIELEALSNGAIVLVLELSA